jgi:hypothetical protein
MIHNFKKALEEYVKIQKHLHDLHMKALLKTERDKDLLNQLDCFLTPDIDDFDIRCNKKSALISLVKRISIGKMFHVSVSK